jgi:hypothetical protein
MRKDMEETNVNTKAAEGIIVSHLPHPTAHFEKPNDVLRAAHLSGQEKRAILASLDQKKMVPRPDQVGDTAISGAEFLTRSSRGR